MKINDNIHIRRAHGTDLAIVIPGGALMLTHDEALRAAEALSLLAGADDAEIIDYPEEDYPEADREASRADFLIKQRKEEADMTRYEDAA